MRKRFFGVLAAGLAGLILAGTVGTAAAEQPRSAATGMAYTTVDPVRVLDTRQSLSIGPGGGVSFNLADRVPAGTTSVVLNITAISPTRSTYITAHDRWAPKPGVSNLNVRAGEIRSNEATVVVQEDRPWVTLYNHNGNVHLVADLVGYYAPDAGGYFNALPIPTRLFDTRTHSVRMPPGGVIRAPLTGIVPEDASAVVVNVTAFQPTTNTFLSVGGGSYVTAATSTVNVMVTEVTANKATVALNPDDHSIAVRNNSGMVDAFVDVLGYYGADGDAYYPTTPVRAFDTRDSYTLSHRGNRRVPLDHVVPVEAETVLFNLTGITDYGNYTHLTAYQAGTTRPNTSTLNLYSLQVASNQTVVPLGVSRAVDLYNHVNYPDAVIDVFGYFAAR